MATPVVVPCPAGQWTKVATNVTNCKVKVVSENPSKYMETYRPTAGAAPTDLTEAVPFDPMVEYVVGAGIDVYIYALNNAGSVRVDT